MNASKSVLCLAEIKRRVQEIQDNWQPYERLNRRLLGEARCESLESLLVCRDSPIPKAA